MATNRAQHFDDVVAAYEAYRSLMKVNEGRLKTSGSSFLELIANGDAQARVALKLAVAEVYGVK
jgi:hypothetical protein